MGLHRLSAPLTAFSLAFLVATGSAQAVPGDLDTSFSGDGFTTVSAELGDEFINGIDEGNGKLVGAGWTSDTVDRNALLIRLKGGGAVDTSFSGDGMVVTGGSADEGWTDVVALEDGSVVAVGAFPGGGGGRVALASYTSGGGRDRAFGRKGIRYANLDPGAERPEALVKMGSSYYVVGSLGSSPNMDMFIARFNGSNGRLDQSYAAGGVRRIDIGLNDTAYSLHRTQDGGMAIGGTAQPSASFQMALAKVSAAGNLVNGFGDGGGTTTLGVSGANAGYDLSRDGSRIVLAGRSLGITYDPAIAIFKADGSPDTSFDGDGFRSYPISPSDGRFASVFVTPDGIIAAGQGSSGIDQDFLLMRVSRSTGAPDATFGGGDGMVFTNLGSDQDAATDTTLVGNTVYLGGWADVGPTFSEAAFARYDLT
ncbi:MAG: hypothetical protein WD004_06250 [Actinomycetota bacterium]